MEVTLKELAGGQVELSITANEAETLEAMRQGAKSFSRQFGLGIADENFDPKDVITKLSKGQNSDAILRSMTMNHLVPFAITQMDITPVTAPVTQGEEVPEAGKPFSFKATTFPRPEYELTSYDPVSLTLDAVTPVTELDIDEQLRRLVKMKTGRDTQLTWIDDNWVRNNMQGTGYNSLKDLRNAIRSSAQRVKAEQAETEKRTAVLTAYGERLKGEVSDELITAFAEEMMANREMQLINQGNTVQGMLMQMGATQEEYEAEMREEASMMLRGLFALDAVRRHEKLKVTQRDLEQAAMSLSHAQGNPADVLKSYENSGRMFMVREAAERSVVFAWVLKKSRTLLTNVFGR